MSLAKGDSDRMNVVGVSALFGGNLERQPVLHNGEAHLIGPVRAALQSKGIVLQDVENRHLPLVLDLGAVAPDGGLVQLDLDDAVGPVLFAVG